MSSDQTYVSQEVCTSVLHECRGALKRASMVSWTNLSISCHNVITVVLAVNAWSFGFTQKTFWHNIMWKWVWALGEILCVCVWGGGHIVQCAHAHVVKHLSFSWTQLLSERELSDVASALYSIILDKLCTEHFHTALDIALAGNSMPL